MQDGRLTINVTTRVIARVIWGQRNNGIIEAVKPVNDSPPAGYEHAEPIRIGNAFSL